MTAPTNPKENAMDDFTRQHLEAWIGSTVWGDERAPFAWWVEQQTDEELAYWMNAGWPSAYKAWQAAAGII